MGRIAPTTTEATDPFWDATKEHQYLVQWCTDCDTPIHYPREMCPTCLSDDALEWKTSGGAGAVHAVSVQHRAANPTMADRVPYAVALIDLDAGDGRRTVRIMSNVVDCDPTTIDVGDRVRLTWEPLDDGRNLPVFTPDEA